MLTGPSVAILVVDSLLSALGILAVGLRIQARRISQQPLSLDDYIIVVALIVVLGAAATYMSAAVVGGVGSHQDQLSLDTTIAFLKFAFALQFPYIISVTLIKLSILIFYRRIFSTPRFRQAVLVMCGLVVAWGITFFFATLFQIKPISGNWDPESATDDGPQPLNSYDMYVAAAVFEIALDLATLCMPLVVIWRLQMGAPQKLVVSSIFLIGAFVCVASIVRLYYLIIHLNPTAEAEEDLTYNIANIVIWSSVEPLLGLICACLPTLGPIFNKRSINSLIATVRSWFSVSSRDRGYTDSSLITQNRIQRARDEASREPHSSEDGRGLVSQAKAKDESLKSSTEIPLESIRVDRTFNFQSRS